MVHIHSFQTIRVTTRAEDFSYAILVQFLQCVCYLEDKGNNVKVSTSPLLTMVQHFSSQAGLNLVSFPALLSQLSSLPALPALCCQPTSFAWSHFQTVLALRYLFIIFAAKQVILLPPAFGCEGASLNIITPLGSDCYGSNLVVSLTMYVLLKECGKVR